MLGVKELDIDYFFSYSTKLRVQKWIFQYIILNSILSGYIVDKIPALESNGGTWVPKEPVAWRRRDGPQRRNRSQTSPRKMTRKFDGLMSLCTVMETWSRRHNSLWRRSHDDNTAARVAHSQGRKTAVPVLLGLLAIREEERQRLALGKRAMTVEQREMGFGGVWGKRQWQGNAPCGRREKG